MTASSRPGAGVVLVDLGAKAPGFDAHDRVEPRIVVGSAAEDFDADDVFLDLIAFARERALDDEAEELGHPIGVGEPLARENALELAPDLVV